MRRTLQDAPSFLLGGVPWSSIPRTTGPKASNFRRRERALTKKALKSLSVAGRPGISSAALWVYTQAQARLEHRAGRPLSAGQQRVARNVTKRAPEHVELAKSVLAPEQPPNTPRGPKWSSSADSSSRGRRPLRRWLRRVPRPARSPRATTKVTSGRDRDTNEGAPLREGDRAASRQLLTTPETSPVRRHRRSGSEADLEAIASQLNLVDDVSDDTALGFDDSGRRLDRLLDDAERRRIQKAYGLGESPRAPRWLPPDRDTSPLRAVVSAPTNPDPPLPLGGGPMKVPISAYLSLDDGRRQLWHAG